jgi:hypothetical protein
MGTFRQSNKLATVGLIFGLFIGGGSSAFANPQISPLDPDYLKPPGTGTGKQAKKEMLPETTALSTTYTNVDGNDNGPLKMPHSKKKFSLKGHDSADNIVSTKVEKVKVPKEEKDKTKEAKAKTKEAKAKTKEAKVASTKDSDGVVGGTKAASAKLSDGMANGTKKVGDGLTSGAKAPGSFFMKGAKAIGSGLKGADKDKTASSSPSKKASAEKLAEEKRPAEEPKKVAKRNDFEEQDKVKSKSKEKAKLDQTDDKKKKGLLSPISNTFKDGLHAATDKLSLTKPGSAEAITAKAEHSTKQAKSKAKADESTYISHGKPVKKAKEAKQSSGPSLVSKTFGKLPFVGGSKKNSGEDVQKVAKSDGDDALVSDPPVKSAGRTEEETPLGPSL